MNQPIGLSLVCFLPIVFVDHVPKNYYYAQHYAPYVSIIPIFFILMLQAHNIKYNTSLCNSQNEVGDPTATGSEPSCTSLSPQSESEN